MHRMHRLILLFSVSALAAIQPASAQFEVAPDHFDNARSTQTEQSARAEQKLKENIAEEQSLLDNYAGQLAAKAQQVENLRQEVISAGIVGDAGGDGADLYLAGLHAGQWELQALKDSLEPLMDSSREVLASLRNDLDTLEAGATSLSAHTHGRSKGLQASARPGR
jgi:hypothetical protein